tara:strand:+ start:111 stop:635 length:525 start_codon:yes stop_codon:yes gene_type:complete
MIPVVQQHIITAIIAPHGITDIIHATKHNTTRELVSLNCLSCASALALSNYNSLLLDGIFTVTSIAHFRHDMPTIQRIPTYVWSSMLLLASILFETNILYGYMVMLHVPNHYKINWKFMKGEPYKNIGLVVLFSLLMIFCGEKYPSMFITPSLFDMSKGVIISHVLYNEKYIHT